MTLLTLGGMYGIASCCINAQCAVHWTLHCTLHTALYTTHCTAHYTLHCTLHTALHARVWLHWENCYGKSVSKFPTLCNFGCNRKEYFFLVFSSAWIWRAVFLKLLCTELCILNSALFTLSTLFTLHLSLCTLHSSNLRSALLCLFLIWTLHWFYLSLFTLLCILHSAFFTLHSSVFSLHSAFFTLYSVLSPLHSALISKGSFGGHDQRLNTMTVCLECFLWVTSPDECRSDEVGGHKATRPQGHKATRPQGHTSGI